jgi:hypothetical protein
MMSASTVCTFVVVLDTVGVALAFAMSIVFAPPPGGFAPTLLIGLTPIGVGVIGLLRMSAAGAGVLGSPDQK